jgi:DNA-binding MarR family transcriptional regulator
MSSLIERSFLDSGLSLTDFILLEALLHKGSMTITEIQASALLATGSMTAAIDRLESKGLIARTLSKSDRRARVLQLTVQGKAVITRAYQEHSGDLKHWMSVLSADERTKHLHQSSEARETTQGHRHGHTAVADTTALITADAWLPARAAPFVSSIRHLPAEPVCSLRSQRMLPAS